MKHEHTVLFLTILQNYFILLVTGISALVMLVFGILNKSQLLTTQIFLAGLSILFIYAGVFHWNVPYKIIFDDVGTITFKYFFRDKTFQITELRFIEVRRDARRWYLYFIFFQRTIRVDHVVNALPVLIERLKSVNPNIETSGI